VLFAGVLPQSPSAEKRKTKVDVHYDRKTDRTTIRLEELILWKNPVHFEQVGLTVAFDYPKSVIVTPKNVSLTFLAASRDWNPFPTNSLMAVLGDARLDLGNLEGGNGNLNRRSDMMERRRISVLFEDFSRIARAKKAAFQIGDRKYDLQVEHLELLQNFLELMQQEGQEFK
jgi:hypothetical protein